ncbi:MAG: DnaJ domain-containing protein [Cryomorphaceae bacterium]|nr:DnaJ domain-containing protein [Cryomorphaceae bacterium]
MIDLTPYLNILGLPPDATWDQVEHRYRTLVIFWHPDRVSSPHHKAIAEEELKKINNAKYKLKQHWRDWQNRPRSSAGPTPSNPGPKTSDSETTKKHSGNRKQENRDARQNREDKNRKRKEKYQREQADFEAQYQQYESSRQKKYQKDTESQKLGERLFRTALFLSAAMVILGISSEALTNSWCESLKNQQESWTIRNKEASLLSRYQKQNHQAPCNDIKSTVNPFAPPMPPP